MQINDLHLIGSNDWNAGFEEGFRKGYNNAIDDFVNACKEDILCQTFGLHIKGIEGIAEQLKAGEAE